MKLKFLLIGRGRQGKKIERVLQRIGEQNSINIQISCIDLRNSVICASGVDACFVCTPNDAHFGNCQDLVRLGVPVFLEKPIADDTIDAAALISLFENNPCSLFVNYNWVYSDLFAILKKIVDEEMIGRINNFSFSYGHGYSFNENLKSDWRLKKASAREMVGVHMYHFLSSLFLGVQPVQLFDFRLSPQASKFGFSDASSIVLSTPELFAHLRVSYATSCHTSVQMHGTDGEAVYDGINLVVRSPRDSFDSKCRYRVPDVSFRQEIDWSQDLELSSYRSVGRFIDNVINQRPVSNPEEINLALLANNLVNNGRS